MNHVRSYPGRGTGPVEHLVGFLSVRIGIAQYPSSIQVYRILDRILLETRRRAGVLVLGRRHTAVAPTAVLPLCS